jgi:hypothetical protein
MMLSEFTVYCFSFTWKTSSLAKYNYCIFAFVHVKIWGSEVPTLYGSIEDETMFHVSFI